MSSRPPGDPLRQTPWAGSMPSALGDALLATLEQPLGDGWSDELAENWRINTSDQVRREGKVGAKVG
jgi:hypothetical protein